MRIVNRKEFLELGDNILYCKYYGGTSVGSLSIKYENIGNNDWGCIDLDTLWSDGDCDTIALLDKLDKANADSSFDFEIDFESTGRDGSYEDEQLFVVYSKKVLNNLINTLNKIIDSVSLLENNNYGIDIVEELSKAFYQELNKSKEEKYSDIKEILNIESFMKATNNNLDILFKYLFSATNGISLSNFQAAEFIKDEYGDDFFYRRELLKFEEIDRNKSI